MQVRMLKTMAGPGGVYYPGDVREVPEAEGRALVGSGAAAALAVRPHAAAVDAVEEQAAAEAGEVAAAPVDDTAVREPARGKAGRGRRA